MTHSRLNVGLGSDCAKGTSSSSFLAVSQMPSRSLSRQETFREQGKGNTNLGWALGFLRVFSFSCFSVSFWVSLGFPSFWVAFGFPLGPWASLKGVPEKQGTHVPRAVRVETCLEISMTPFRLRDVKAKSPHPPPQKKKRGRTTPIAVSKQVEKEAHVGMGQKPYGVDFAASQAESKSKTLKGWLPNIDSFRASTCFFFTRSGCRRWTRSMLRRSRNLRASRPLMAWCSRKRSAPRSPRGGGTEVDFIVFFFSGATGPFPGGEGCFFSFFSGVGTQKAKHGWPSPTRAPPILTCQFSFFSSAGVPAHDLCP